MAAIAAVALGGCGDSGGGSTRVEVGPPPAVERAEAAIRSCRVRSVLSLHSGRLFLELKDGGRIELALDDQRRISAELARAEPRCGPVIVATE